MDLAKVPFTEYDPDWKTLSDEERSRLTTEQAGVYDLYTVRNRIRKNPFTVAHHLAPKSTFAFAHTLLTAEACVALIEERLYKDAPGKPTSGITCGHIAVDEVHPDVPCDIEPGSPVMYNLVIDEPPRHGKSFIVSHNLPVMYLARHPDHTVLLASYAAEFAANWGEKARETFRRLQTTFNLKISSSSKAKDHWTIVDYDGGMNTFGAGGPVTGLGGHLLIGDDLIKNAEEANSDTIRDGRWNWLTSTFLNRTAGVDFRTKKIIMHTRWHEDDPVGRLLEREPQNWYHLHIPAFCDDPQNDPLFREEGEALCPRLVSVRELEEYRDRDAYWFSALYQGSPTPEGAGLFKRSKLRYYLTEAQAPKYYTFRHPELPDQYVLKEDCLYYCVADLALSEKTSADYTVFGIFGVTPPMPPREENYLFLAGLWRRRVESADHMESLRNFVLGFQFKVSYIGIEGKRVKEGKSLVSHLRRTRGLPPVIELDADRDKFTRAIPAANLWDQGQFYVWKDAPYLSTWVSEHTIFNKGKHDDQVDVTSMAVDRFLKLHQSFSGARGSGMRGMPDDSLHAKIQRDLMKKAKRRKNGGRNRL